MSDIQKLNMVINSLEEQSLKVSEFNGVLSAINSAKKDIMLAKSKFEELEEKQEKLVTKSYIQFDEFSSNLAALESKFSELNNKTLTTEQFEIGKAKILLRTSEQRFLAPEQFEQGISNTENTIQSQITKGNSELEKLIESHVNQGNSKLEKLIESHVNQGNSKLEKLIKSQEKSIQQLRIFVVLEILVVIGCFLYLSRELFL